MALDKMTLIKNESGMWTFESFTVVKQKLEPMWKMR